MGSDQRLAEGMASDKSLFFLSLHNSPVFPDDVTNNCVMQVKNALVKNSVKSSSKNNPIAKNLSKLTPNTFTSRKF